MIGGGLLQAKSSMSLELGASCIRERG
jgi:hypothetical protein